MDDGSWGMKAGGTSGGMTEAHQDREKRLNLGFRLRSSSVCYAVPALLCKGNLGRCEPAASALSIPPPFHRLCFVLFVQGREGGQVLLTGCCSYGRSDG
jgi:hypothetical protein